MLPLSVSTKKGADPLLRRNTIFVATVYYTVVLVEHLFPRAIPVCWSNMDNAPVVRCYGGPVFRSDGVLDRRPRGGTWRNPLLGLTQHARCGLPRGSGGPICI